MTKPGSVSMRERLPRTATWVRMTDSGGVEIEHYDFSDDAHDSFGNDVAFFVVVQPADLPKLRACLGCPEGSLPAAIAGRFGGYHEAKRWLLAQDIPVQARFDPWA